MPRTPTATRERRHHGWAGRIEPGPAGTRVSGAILCWAVSLLVAGAAARMAAGAEGPPEAVNAPEAEAHAAEPEEFGHLDFEDLRRVKVVTATRVESSVQAVAAAAHVITPADIRRSGARSLPDLLRLSPGVEVGRVNSRTYSVTVRGFNGISANKLLPMIDGRSIYSQRFSGTIWDARDVMLEDVERVEVIRGPGGTAWGANAVNGVINVLTKDARDTQGTLLSFGGGSLLHAFTTVRHGFGIGENAWMRVFAKGFVQGETSRLDGGDPNDGWNFARGGFRADFQRNSRTHWSVMGDAFTSDADQVLPPSTPSTAHTTGGVLQVRGRIEGGAGSATSVNAYYDRLHRDSGGLTSHADVVEADIQHAWHAGGRHDLTIGANGRFSRLEDRDAVVGGVQSTFDPALRYFHQAGVFLQDEIAVVPGRLGATIGCKLEYDDFTQGSPLPSLRLAWTPSPEHTLWGAVSRATRIPSRAENDLTVGIAGMFTSSPNTELAPETVTAYELGYRSTALPRVTVDLAAYYSAYEDLYGNVDVPAPTPTETIENAILGEAWGGSVDATWQPLGWWQLRGSLTWVEIALRPAMPGVSRQSESAEALSPAQQASLRSSWTAGSALEADLWFRYVGELPGRVSAVPAYSALDARVSWRARESVLLSLSGQNLLEPLHQEFRFFVTRWEIPRSVTAEVTLRF